jgi:hypothetical protein
MIKIYKKSRWEMRFFFWSGGAVFRVGCGSQGARAVGPRFSTVN